MYHIYLPYGKLTYLLKMAHRNSWFTELKDGDFPVRYVSLLEGIYIYVIDIHW